MQPSEYEIQREVEALRDIRRRSTNQGVLLDPDLPSPSSPASPNSPYWNPPPADDSSSSSHEDGSDNSSVISSDDPSHLFWVPARLHPEIAPAEFRAFLKDHARVADGTGATVSRSDSTGSQGLGRKKSMLSRVYKPSPNDGVEAEEVVPIRKNRTSVFITPTPQLTISDLQKLEELAEEASKSDDPTKLRSILRRSLTLNVAPSVIDQMDMPDMGDEADIPIIVPPPGQILRRAARTKIRKAGTGEGPHRFTSTRGRSRAKTKRMSGDRTSLQSDQGDIPPMPDVPAVPTPRPESYSEESSIYDAYASQDTDEQETSSENGLELSPPSVATPLNPLPPLQLSLQPYDSQRDEYPPLPSGSSTHSTSLYSPIVSAQAPVLEHPQPQRLLSPITSGSPIPLRTPSPGEPSPASPSLDALPPPSTQAQPQQRPPPQEQQRPPLVHETSVAPYQPPSPPEHRRDKEKDKKGLFGKWGGDKGGKRGGKEKDSGFFGSLFGKKKAEEVSPPPIGGMSNGGRETAVALLGASKSKSQVPAPSTSPQPMGPNGYARYPIHVERAIYRLSHIKLANPRRPLYEQVLISNLMFWYLGVINKTQGATNGTSPTTPTDASPTGAPAANGAADAAAVAEKEKKEKEEKEKAEREKAEREKEKEEKQKREPRRGSLTKTVPQGQPGARRAEMPIKGPQYDMQHRAMEQEYANAGGAYSQQPPGPPGMGRPSSAPPMGGPAGYPPSQQTRGSSQAPGPYIPGGSSPSISLVQPQPQRYNNGVHGGPLHPHLQHQQQGHGMIPSLPPGAMPPVNVEQGMWSSNAPPMPSNRHSTSPPPRGSSPPMSATRRAKSPPHQPRYSPAQEKQPMLGVGAGPGRAPGRSLSANAVPPVPPIPRMNGDMKLRKGQSAVAVMQHPKGISEEEDVPLAVYQAQRRK